MFNVVIAVSDDWMDYNSFCASCDYLLSSKVNSGEGITLITTKEKSIVNDYAETRGFTVIPFVPNWKRDGKQAAWKQCQLALGCSNACVAFYSAYGNNSYVSNLVKQARLKHLLIREIKEDE